MGNIYIGCGCACHKATNAFFVSCRNQNHFCLGGKAYRIVKSIDIIGNGYRLISPLATFNQGENESPVATNSNHQIVYPVQFQFVARPAFAVVTSYKNTSVHVIDADITGPTIMVDYSSNANVGIRYVAIGK